MKKTTLVAVGLLLAVVVPVLAYTFRTPMQAVPVAQGGEGTSLTIYQIGLSYVVTQVEATFAGGKGSIILPASMIPQTLRIVDPDPVAMTLKGRIPEQLLLVKGDNITVHTATATYSGTYEGVKDGYLVLGLSGASILVKLEAITSIEVERAVLVEAPVEGVRVEIEAVVSDGPHNVTATFLTRGTSWQANHLLDVDSGSIRTWASVTSYENWTDARLSLVVGQPHIVFEGPIRYAFDESKTQAGAPAPIEWTVSGLGEYHEFQLSRPISLAAGGTTMLLLLNGSVGVEREYFWSSSQPYYYGVIPPVSESPVVEYVNVTNTLSQPLPKGLAQLYREQKWVGNDWMPYIAVDANAKMTVGLALDVEVKHEVTNIQHLVSSDRVTVQLTALNHKKEDIVLVLQQTIPYDATLIQADPKPQQLGQVLTWNVAVPRGQSTFVTYTYEVPVRK